MTNEKPGIFGDWTEAGSWFAWLLILGGVVYFAARGGFNWIFGVLGI